MARNRILAFLTALCLLLSVFPVHTHALGEDPLEQMYHDRCQQDATRQVRVSGQGPWLVSPKAQAVLPAGTEGFLVEDTFGDLCQWAIDTGGWLYIWCNGPMPVRSSPEEYPWNAYRHLFSQLYIDSHTVADYAFAGSSNLTLVRLDEKTAAIGEAAFANCTGLEEFWFYGPAPSIASNAFSSVNAVLLYHWSDASYDSLTDQSFGGELYWSTWLDALASGMLGTVEWFVCEDMSLRLYGTGSAMADLAAPGNYPWNDWRGSITSLFCENVTHLGSFALADCPALTYAAFDSVLNSIGDGAFRGCDGLTLSFAGSAPSLGKEAFTGDGLTLEYPQDDPTWTDAAIDRFYGIETPSVEPGKITCGITAQQVYDAMIALKPQYPEGMPWTNDDYYAWNGGDFTGGYGCAGFAFILSDAAFGTEPSRRITENITIDDVRVGDILRINNDTHSIIVLEVYEDHVVVAEGNFNSSIHWGRTFDADKIASVTDYIMTRYPEHDWSSDSCLEARSCAKCGTYEEAPGHRWLDATCSSPKTCSACGLTEGQPLEHSWVDATCSNPQTCSLCKMTLGEPTGKHVFTGAGDSSCNVCGYIRDIGDIPPEVLCPLPEEALEYLRRINQQRAAAGLNPLTTPETLHSATNARARELLVLFDHKRPNGESWSTLLKEASFPYSVCTENISQGYGSAAKAFESWFGNSSHISLFLDPNFGYAALGSYEDAYAEIFTDASGYSQIRVDIPETASFPTGTPIEHMGLVAVLRSDAGDCWLPLTSAYCPGYNPELSGVQTVTVSVLGVTCSFTLTLEGETTDHTHSWTAATCETAQICTECGQTEGAPLGHQWTDATCQSPKTCGRCGAAEGAPTGIHTYTDDADISCNVCGQLREVETAPETVPLSDLELEVLRLTNLERLAQGLNPLTATEALQQATDIRAEEIRAYFSHTRPNGTSCFTILDELGIRYGAAAENIAAGYGTPAAVMTGWMNSQGHRDNILTPALGHLGVGELNRSWVQLFTSAPAYTDIRVAVPEGASFKPGTPLDDLGLVAVLRNSNGDCWLPLASAFCTGYDPNTPGTQTVTVSVLGVTCTFALTLEGHTHTWVDATCETPQTCSECGKAEGAPLGHNWVAASCEAPKTCSACGKTEGAAIGHSWVNATCEAPKTCSACGKTEGSAVGHSWKDATCETPKICSACGKTEGSALGHDWNAASCEAPGTCKRCGKTEGSAVGHSWKDATCETPKTCSACGKTEGSALGHNWKGPTCEEPKTCARCGKTEGSPLLHAWDNGTVTRQPTFDQEGLKVYTCMDCGGTRTESIPVLQNPFAAIDKPDTVLPHYDFSYDIPKDGATVLIFFSSLCGNSISLMRQLNECDWMANPWLEVVAIETKVGTAEAVAEFRDTYTPDVKEHIRYLFTQSNDMQFDYFRLFCSENRLTWPLVMVITGTEESPVVRFGAQAMTNPNALESSLSLVSPAFAQWDGTAHEHTWVDATCQTPKTCSACGQTEGTALGHDWKPASCETAKTCARCGQTEGSAAGHSWLDATCQTPKTCSACGKTEGDPIDHNFVDGKCAVCGTQERKAGDADGNGVLNYSDALLILRASIGLETLPQEILDICDVDGDGTANYSDALLILRFSIGLITEFPGKK